VTRRTESIVSWVVVALLAAVAAAILFVQADYDPAKFSPEPAAAVPAATETSR
jgi:hypothetical protein